MADPIDLMAHPISSPELTFLHDTRTGLTAYLLTSIPVFIGLFFGLDFVTPYSSSPSRHRDFFSCFSRFDPPHYVEIIESGYSYSPQKRSMVAFFPVYPLLASGVCHIAGCVPLVGLLIVSHVSLAACFVVFARYLRVRWPDSTHDDRILVLALFGLWPAGLFFRMPYSESTFLLVTLLVLYGMARRWPVIALAFLAGIATATRPVGVAVAAAVAWHILAEVTRGSFVRRMVQVIAILPLACWGLLAYMVYQHVAFGEPLAFAQTQQHWFIGSSIPAPIVSVSKEESLLLGEPIWGTYVPNSQRNWTQFDRHGNAFFSMFFWHPILFVGTAVLIIIGWYRFDLTDSEVVLGLGLLAIPYVTRSYEMSMGSHGRFAAVVIPAYVVLGRLLRNQPSWATTTVLAAAAMLLMGWSALFAVGYLFF